MGSLWEHNVQNTEEFGKVHFENYKRQIKSANF